MVARFVVVVVVRTLAAVARVVVARAVAVAMEPEPTDAVDPPEEVVLCPVSPVVLTAFVVRLVDRALDVAASVVGPLSEFGETAFF